MGTRTLDIELGEHTLTWPVEITVEPTSSHGHPIYLRSYFERDAYILAKQAERVSVAPYSIALKLGERTFRLEGTPSFSADGNYTFADTRVYTDEATWLAIKEADIQCDLQND